MIGEDIISLFASLGEVGMLLSLFVIIMIDGVLFPTLPEVWIVFIFGAQADLFSWGIVIILIASLSSLAGIFTLYGAVKMAGMPKWIQKRMRQYTQFLIIKDERLLLLNRIAPLVPYTGAFMAVCNWHPRKSAIYVMIGALAKFSVVVIISWLSFDNLRKEVAPWVSLGMVAIILLASLVLSVIYKKKIGMRGEPERSQ